MTTHYHTPPAIGAAADAFTLRSPLGELDEAIYRGSGRGTAFPGSPNDGDKFYRTDLDTWYFYNATTVAWVAFSTASSGSSANIDIEGTAGEALAERNYVYLDRSAPNRWKKVDTNASPVACGPDRGFVVEAGGIANGATGAIRVAGVASGFAGLTAGDDVWADTTAGGVTQTKPTLSAGGSQVAIVRLGVALSATEILIRDTHVQFAKRASLTNTSTLTIEHYADEQARGRIVRAHVSTTESGVSLAAYADSNQDTGVDLRGASAPGGTTTPDNSGTTALALGDLSGTDYWLAQTFQIAAGILSQITVYHLANVGTPSGNVTWQICADGGTAPGSVLASGVYTPTPSSNNIIPVTGGPLLAASTTYWLVLKPTSAQATDNRWQCAHTTPGGYAGGQDYFSLDGGGSWSSGSGDLRCSMTTSAVTVKDKLAQSFQIGSGATVEKVRLYLKKTGAPTGTMTLRIETDSTGTPSGTLADANATVTVAESILTTSYGFIDFDFGTNFALSAATTYWLVLSTDRVASGTNYVTWGADGSSPGYASGEMKSEVSAAWGAESKDAVFDVVGVGTTYQEPLVIGRESGGTRDMAVRYDDGVGANGDTKTTFKNVIGSTVDATVIVELP